MEKNFEMVAKTFRGLEEVLAAELRKLGADDVVPGNRMVSFRGNLAMLYKANMCCRTALRILKPFYSFDASDADALYAKVKDFKWNTLLDSSKTFAIDSTVYSEEFRHSQFVTYRVKDGIMDWFRDNYDDGARPKVRLDGADIQINVHISGRHVTLSLDSSGESLHRRGWRKAQTEAPISEVLAAGIILMSGWDGTTPFVDPMCGSGTFLVEAAMIAAGIAPGIYRKHFAFETWPDFDAELLQEIYNDDSSERDVTVPIIGADINPKALEIARANVHSAGLEKYITLETKSISAWTEAPQPRRAGFLPATDSAQPGGVLVTNPPYGKRIGADDMNALYASIGRTLKHVFTGYHCWIIGYEDVYFHEIGLAPSQKVDVNNGGLDCELREYVIFDGKKADFRARGGAIKQEKKEPRAKQTNRTSRTNRTNQTNPRKDRSDRSEKSEKSRRPLKLDRLGRKPSISADKEIVLNRPVWRVRKKNQNSDNQPDNTEK